MDLDWAKLPTAPLRKLTNRVAKLENRVATAVVGHDLISFHVAAAAIGESLRDAVSTSNVRLKNAADKLERALSTSTSRNALPLYAAATVIVTCIKVAIAAAEAPLQDAVTDVDKVINSVVNVVDTVVAAAATARNDPTFALAQGSIKASLALMDAMSEITRASTSIPLTPIRVVAAAITAAIETFATEEKDSYLLVIAKAVGEAIIAAAETESPLTAASEAFKRTIESAMPADAPRESAMPADAPRESAMRDVVPRNSAGANPSVTELLKSIDEMVLGLRAAASSSSPKYEHMIQILSWTVALNKMVKSYPYDAILQVAVDNVQEAVRALKEELDGRPGLSGVRLSRRIQD